MITINRWFSWRDADVIETWPCSEALQREEEGRIQEMHANTDEKEVILWQNSILRNSERTAYFQQQEILVGGYLEPKIDNYINTNVKMLSSNATLNPNAASAKYMKTAVYTIGALAVDAATEIFDGGDE